MLVVATCLAVAAQGQPAGSPAALRPRLDPAAELALLAQAFAASQADIDAKTQRRFWELDKRLKDLVASEKAGAIERRAAAEERRRLSDEIVELSRQLEERDREFAEERRRQRLRLQPGRLSASAEGAGLAEKFLSGEVEETLPLLDRLAAARREAKAPARQREDATDPETDRAVLERNQRAREKQRRFEDAVDLRDIAHLTLVAHGQQQLPLAEVTRRFRQVVDFDGADAWDAVTLARLYRQSADAEGMKKYAFVARQMAVPAAERPLALSEIGLSLRLAGQLKDARKELEEALTLRQQQLNAQPIGSSPALDLKRYLSVAQERMGELALDEGRLALAVQHFDACLRLRRELAAAPAPLPSARRDLALALDQLGRARLERGELAPADAALGEARQIAEALLRDATAASDGLANVPFLLEAQRDMAVALSRQADLALLRNRREEAQGLQQRSFELRQNILRSDPQSPRLRRDLAAAWVKQGDLRLKFDHQPEAALKAYEEAAALSTWADARSGEFVPGQRDRLALHAKRAWALAQTGAVVRALAEYEPVLRALEDLVKKVPELATVRRDRAHVLLRAGSLLLDRPASRDHRAWKQAGEHFSSANQLIEQLLRLDDGARTTRAVLWHSLVLRARAHDKLGERSRREKFEKQAAEVERALLGGREPLDGVPESALMLLDAALLAEALVDVAYAEKLRPIIADMKSRKVLAPHEAAKLESVTRRMSP